GPVGSQAEGPGAHLLCQAGGGDGPAHRQVGMVQDLLGRQGNAQDDDPHPPAVGGDYAPNFIEMHGAQAQGQALQPAPGNPAGFGPRLQPGEEPHLPPVVWGHAVDQEGAGDLVLADGQRAGFGGAQFLAFHHAGQVGLVAPDQQDCCNHQGGNEGPPVAQEPSGHGRRHGGGHVAQGGVAVAPAQEIGGQDGDQPYRHADDGHPPAQAGPQGQAQQGAQGGEGAAA